MTAAFPKYSSFRVFDARALRSHRHKRASFLVFLVSHAFHDERKFGSYVVISEHETTYTTEGQHEERQRCRWTSQHISTLRTCIHKAPRPPLKGDMPHGKRRCGLHAMAVQPRGHRRFHERGDLTGSPVTPGTRAMNLCRTCARGS
jgi:hypothetical protein